MNWGKIDNLYHFPFQKSHVCHSESVSRQRKPLINGLLPHCLDDICKGLSERDSRLQSGTYRTYSQIGIYLHKHIHTLSNSHTNLLAHRYSRWIMHSCTWIMLFKAKNTHIFPRNNNQTITSGKRCKKKTTKGVENLRVSSPGRCCYPCSGKRQLAKSAVGGGFEMCY